ncbi:MAG TPA: carotenoid oxygenase family protein [Steroidobacteraceae bacterium]|nr:carotenoid oxygenase family protein [Steroidobacteraceae bacterium]
MKFPDVPMFAGVNAPCRAEVDLQDLEVDGDIPREIDGAFYRVAADHQFPPLFAQDVPFNGDGMVSMFRFRDGRVHLKSRYVQTDRFKAERAAGRALFGRYRNKWTDDPAVAGMNRNLANTSVLIHHGVLLALREDSPPMALDPLTLETIGSWDFHGTLPGPTCSAHCKIDPVTGNLVGFGFGAKGDFTRDVVYFEVDPRGRVIHQAWFQTPYFEEQHDCGVTRDYIVFPVVPILGAGEQGLKAGYTYYGWNPDREIYLGVLPRFGKGGDIRWFTAPNQFTSHVMNAFNEGSRVHIDVCRSPGNLFPFFPEFGKPFDPKGLGDVKLTRWTVDVTHGSPSPESAPPFERVLTLSDFIGEFPRNDDRFQMRDYRHGWLLGFAGARNSLGHVDLQSGRLEHWQAADTSPVMEPCFIARSPDSAEGDGWIVQALTNGQTMRTELNLFGATEIAKGPIANIRLPLRLKPAYHGSWSAAAAVKSSGLL